MAMANELYQAYMYVISRHLGIDSLYVRYVCQASSRPYRKLLVRISHIAHGCKMFIISSVHTKFLKTSLWQCRELKGTIT